MSITQVYISHFVQMTGSLIVGICCLLSFPLRPNYIRVLGYTSIVSFILSIAQFIVLQVGLNVNPIGNLSTIVEAIFFALLYYLVMPEKQYRKGVGILAILYGLFLVCIFIVFREQYFSLIRFGRDFLFVIYSVIFFYYLLQKLPETNLLQLPMFWINTAVIFYFSGTFILSYMRDYIVNQLGNDFSGFLVFKNLFKLPFCILLTYAGWLDFRAVRNKFS